jgi:hypothetical protein
VIARLCGARNSLRAVALGCGCLAAALCAPRPAGAQAGPPFLTNDPGTPGNANWEINLGSAQTIQRGSASYQVPQFDFNFGVGERIQLTFEIPYVVERIDGEAQHSGWGNAFPGLKWRFLDQGEDGWNLSTFPQIETGSSAAEQQRGIASPGPRLLVPFEAARKIGPIDFDVEAGYYFPKHGAHERIAGLVVGHSFTERLELDAEAYYDHAEGAPPHYVLLDLGGRYKLSPSFIALFMAGRSVSGTASGQPQFNGYFGIQILLSDYGRSLMPGS